MYQNYESFKKDLGENLNEFFRTNDLQNELNFAEKLADMEEENKEWFDKAFKELYPEPL